MTQQQSTKVISRHADETSSASSVPDHNSAAAVDAMTERGATTSSSGAHRGLRLTSEREVSCFSLFISLGVTIVICLRLIESVKNKRIFC